MVLVTLEKAKNMGTTKKQSSKKKSDKILCVIGCGGVGSHFIPPILRWNSFTKTYKEVHLIDGDFIEPKNLDRQNFTADSIMENKAEAIKRTSPSNGFKVVTHPIYVNSDRLRRIFSRKKNKEIHIVMGVDNMKSRKEINDYFNGLDNAFLISCGNEYSDGNIQMASRKNGKAITPDITCCHPEIGEPKDKSPLELGCMEIIESSPQLIFANMTGAMLALNALYGYNVGKLKLKRDVYFDVPTVSFEKSDFPVPVLTKEKSKKLLAK